MEFFMKYSIDDVLQYVDENDVKFIRLAFCDIFGTQKNIAIQPSMLNEAFTKGILINTSFLDGFGDKFSGGVCLFPDPSTLALLPWRPSHARVVRLFCDIKNGDGTPFEMDSRALLKNAVKKAKSMGYIARAKTDCEFYVFKMDEDENPTLNPLDHGTYLDIAPNDKCENIRREICLFLEDMGISPKSSFHANGPAQNQVNFQHGSAVEAADNLFTFKNVVKSTAQRNGVYASFMPKPLAGESGNGLHISFSIKKDDKNIFSVSDGELSDDAKFFAAGILRRINELSVFLNPTTNSYQRLGENYAPNDISWSDKNGASVINLPCSPCDEQRIKIGSADTVANAYLAIGLLLFAGLEGIENKEKLPIKEVSMGTIAPSLSSAIGLAEKSEFLRKFLPAHMLDTYIDRKKKECDGFNRADSTAQFEKNTYFEIL